MTTITIKNGQPLSRNVFRTFEELIEEYYASQGIVMMHQADFDNLPATSQKSIEDSQKKGLDDLYDFQG